MIPLIVALVACNTEDQKTTSNAKDRPITIIDSTNIAGRNTGATVPTTQTTAQPIASLNSAAQQAGQLQQGQVVMPTQGLTYTNNKGQTLTEAEYKQLMLQQAAQQQKGQTQVVQQAVKGMNPAHGQPGHRCDIAVGQPLNSKPVAKTTATTVTSPAQQVQAAATPTAPGMNPPHGQPGHKCEIAVGQPLNSKPAASSTNTITTAAPADSSKH